MRLSVEEEPAWLREAEELLTHRELGHGEVDRGVANDGADEWGGEAALGARESAASDAALLSIIAKYPFAITLSITTGAEAARG